MKTTSLEHQGAVRGARAYAVPMLYDWSHAQTTPSAACECAQGKGSVDY